MFERCLKAEDVRSLILYGNKIKNNNKCSRCNGTGYTNWNGETGNDEKAGRLRNYDSVRMDGECETCEGIGYIDIFDYVDLI